MLWAALFGCRAILSAQRPSSAAVCSATNVYFIDSGKAVGDGTGAALSSYLSSNGKTLNSSGINEVLSYLRTHALTTE